MSQRTVKFAVEVREILVIGPDPDSESAEYPIDCFPQHPRPRKHSCRRERSPSGLQCKGACLRRGEHTALACPLNQIPVPIEPLNRLTTPAPAHRVGEVQARRATRQVKDPALDTCLFRWHPSRFPLDRVWHLGYLCVCILTTVR